MQAEDRAAQALAKHYDIAGGTDMVRLRCPRLHEIITTLITEAEARGYQEAQTDQAKAEQAAKANAPETIVARVEYACGTAAPVDLGEGFVTVHHVTVDPVTFRLVERDAEWAAQLGAAGFDYLPLTPGAVAAAVAYHDGRVEAARDGQWMHAFVSTIDNAEPGTVCPVPSDPAGVARAVEFDRRRTRREMIAHADGKAADAARTARRREVAACGRVALDRFQFYLDAAKGLPVYSQSYAMYVAAAEALLDVARAIANRDPQNVPADRQAAAGPLA